LVLPYHALCGFGGVFGTLLDALDLEVGLSGTCFFGGELLLEEGEGVLGLLVLWVTSYPVLELLDFLLEVEHGVSPWGRCCGFVVLMPLQRVVLRGVKEKGREGARTGEVGFRRGVW